MKKRIRALSLVFMCLSMFVVMSGCTKIAALEKGSVNCYLDDSSAIIIFKYRVNQPVTKFVVTINFEDASGRILEERKIEKINYLAVGEKLYNFYERIYNIPNADKVRLVSVEFVGEADKTMAIVFGAVSGALVIFFAVCIVLEFVKKPRKKD